MRDYMLINAGPFKNTCYNEQMIVDKIMHQYGFKCEYSKPDKNKVITVTITGENRHQKLNVLVLIATKILFILREIEEPVFLGRD